MKSCDAALQASNENSIFTLSLSRIIVTVFCIVVLRYVMYFFQFICQCQITYTHRLFLKPVTPDLPLSSLGRE